jgi:hypothetical protein
VLEVGVQSDFAPAMELPAIKAARQTDVSKAFFMSLEEVKVLKTSDKIPLLVSDSGNKQEEYYYPSLFYRFEIVGERNLFISLFICLLVLVFTHQNLAFI